MNSFLNKYRTKGQNSNIEIWLAEIKLRARRKVGEITKNIESKQGKKNGSLTSSGTGRSDTKTEILANSGLTRSADNRYEKIAEIPEEKSVPANQ